VTPLCRQGEPHEATETGRDQFSANAAQNHARAWCYRDDEGHLAVNAGDDTTQSGLLEALARTPSDHGISIFHQLP